MQPTIRTSSAPDRCRSGRAAADGIALHPAGCDRGRWRSAAMRPMPRQPPRAPPTPAASQPDRVLCQNATLALARFRTEGSGAAAAPISRMACTLFSSPSTQSPAASRHAERSRELARRPTAIRIISAKMTGQAATSSLRRMRECTAMPPDSANASVAIIATRQSRTMRRTRAGEDQHADDRDQKGEHASGADGAGHRGVEGRDIRLAMVWPESVQASSRPSACSRANQDCAVRNGQIGGVIEEVLRLAVIQWRARCRSP